MPRGMARLRLPRRTSRRRLSRMRIPSCVTFRCIPFHRYASIDRGGVSFLTIWFIGFRVVLRRARICSDPRQPSVSASFHRVVQA
eukprot:9992550-Lingulodinium_polyedra.AAC.1